MQKKKKKKEKKERKERKEKIRKKKSSLWVRRDRQQQQWQISFIMLNNNGFCLLSIYPLWSSTQPLANNLLDNMKVDWMPIKIK